MQWGTQSPKGVDPTSRRRGQGDQQGPRRGMFAPGAVGGKWALIENIRRPQMAGWRAIGIVEMTVTYAQARWF